MDVKHVGSVPSLGGNFTDVAGFIPYPRRIFGGRIMHQLLARAGRRDVEQLHGILSGRIFIIIGEDEQLRQL
jgi:hypothetical protein